MRIEKRTLTKYVLLNCLTLGIYGFIVAKDMDNEINAICKGDKQEPGMSYVLAWLFSKLAGVGTIYYTYWWYQQANRLKVNANRYGLNVKESGTDIFLMRGIMNIPLFAITALEIFAAFLAPGLLALIFSLMGAYILSIIILGLAGLTLILFGNELNGGATLANYYMMKNLNRFADAVRNGGAEFDPMAYENYPCVAVKYPAMVGGVAVAAPVKEEVNVEPPEEPRTSLKLGGVLVGEKGTCAGYKFDLNPGEEIIIGKDAKVASVVIDPAYKEISRKHVGVTYDIVRDQYCVVDYSSNGTWANGSKLTAGQAVYLPHGTELELANAKNRFLLG